MALKKIAFLFNKVRTKQDISKNHFYGMYGLREHGFTTTYLEVEHILPKRLCTLLRKKILTMHYAHLPLFPLFFAYDAIITSTAYASMIVFAALRSVGIHWFKWILLDFNILGTIGSAGSFRQKLFKWSVSKVDAIVAISEAEKEGLQSMFPHLANKIVFIPEATDLELFSPTESSASGRGVLAVGTYGRDWKTLVEAVKGTDINLTIATKPRLVQDLLPLPHNVTARLYTPQEMKQLYSDACAVVVPLNPDPSYVDSVGTLSVGEAMAMGKAVVVSRTKSMESYIQDGVNGIYVEPRNVEMMREVLLELVGNKEKQETIGKSARTYAETVLSDKNFSKHLALLLQQL
ncbi:MAG: hypothetical protein RLY57_108 [Candidatus Parcubacteria bacterium]|jgi:glycosyltransferase involved in cell wall biosynthesis